MNKVFFILFLIIFFILAGCVTPDNYPTQEPVGTIEEPVEMGDEVEEIFIEEYEEPARPNMIEYFYEEEYEREPEQIEEPDPIPVYIPEPEPTPPPVTSRYSCSREKTCKEMNSCEEAYYHLHVCGYSKRDGDNDGVPCENICPGG